MGWQNLGVMYENIPKPDDQGLSAVIPYMGHIISYEFQNKPTIYYNFDDFNTFSSRPIVTMPESEKNDVRNALGYISSISGIKFTETTDTIISDMAFVSDKCWTYTSYSQLTESYGNYGVSALTWQNPDPSNFHKYAMIQLDKNQSASYYDPGNRGYERLLGEIGYALGLNHPSYHPNGDKWTTQQTVMAYQHAGDNATTFRDLDIAALNWLYGGDGLGGTAQGVALSSLWSGWGMAGGAAFGPDKQNQAGAALAVTG
jgi:hypothetical protein